MEDGEGMSWQPPEDTTKPYFIDVKMGTGEGNYATACALCGCLVPLHFLHDEDTCPGVGKARLDESIRQDMWEEAVTNGLMDGEE